MFYEKANGERFGYPEDIVDDVFGENESGFSDRSVEGDRRSFCANVDQFHDSYIVRITKPRLSESQRLKEIAFLESIC